MVLSCRRCDHRPGRYQLFPHRIDLQVQPLERVRAKTGHVARCRKHEEVRRFRPARAHQCVPYIALDATTIGDFESLFPLCTDAQLLEHPARDPGEFAARIDERLRERTARAAQLPILDLDRRAKDSHVAHDKSFVIDLDTNFTASRLQFPASNPAIEGMKALMTRCSCIAAVFLIAGCYWERSRVNEPTPIPPHDPVWIWTKGGVEKWHWVIITQDSVSGVPWKSDWCLMCRRSIPRV